MSELLTRPRASASAVSAPLRAGVIVHPTRDIELPMSELRQWADDHRAHLVQIPIVGQDRRVAEPGDAEQCDLIISIGGDGTMLAALRAATLADRPVLGVGCGSLGALTTVEAIDLPHALDRFAAGDWMPDSLPALQVARGDGDDLFALNDIAVVRAGIGQVRTVAEVDGSLFCRIAGDGCIVSTPLGSSAYALAAGGPLLAPGLQGYLLTPLPTHGGSCPAFVVGAQAVVRISTAAGLGGARLELDGQIVGEHSGELTLGLRPDVVTRVSFADAESTLTGLRRRRVIVDSPRLVAEDGDDH
jgi:NAD+ kinase